MGHFIFCLYIPYGRHWNSMQNCRKKHKTPTLHSTHISITLGRMPTRNYKIHRCIFIDCSALANQAYIIDLVASICLSVCVSVCFYEFFFLNSLTFDLEFVHRVPTSRNWEMGIYRYKVVCTSKKNYGFVWWVFFNVE